MLVRTLLALFGLFHLLGGLYMLIAPHEWYASVPGVTATGPFNHHFITDIGFAFAASGVGMMMGFRTGRVAAAFALAGATWPTLHALFHLWGWISGGVPGDSRVLLSEAFGVMLVSFLGFGLAWLQMRRAGAD
jgi:hypothetical protein